jgi:hypothetical protein
MNENIKEILTSFLEQARTENLTTNKYPKSYLGLKLKVGFGQGTPARIPWVSFLGNGQSTANGIYPVYLYYKEHSKLILAYGISETNPPNLQWKVSKVQTIVEYFNKEYGVDPPRYGDSFVFKEYDLNGSLNWNELENDLEKIIIEYNNLLKPDGLIHSIVEAIASNRIQSELNEAEFLFSKGKEKLLEFDNYKEPRKNFFNNIFQVFIKSKSTYTTFIKTLEPNSDEFNFLKIIAQLISYCDYHAANKNKLNEYEDKRTLAKSGVRQTPWVESLLKYKMNKNDKNFLPPSIKNAISYLMNPDKELTMLSENHRAMAARNLLKVRYDKDKFVNQVLEYFNAYKIEPKNSLNLTRIISNILYEFPDVKSLWFDELEDDRKNDNLQLSIEFNNHLEETKLQFSHNLVNRFISSLLSKPFIVLTGLSGSGKTKLAQAFTYWITESENQYCIIPVGADWTNREPLLGFPNALDPGKYIKPENGVVDLLIEASKRENADKPFFLILDEMNLSHVERYFADFLSTMESEEPVYLHSPDNWEDDVPSTIKLPKNLFIIGTVNVDETTYMFSPKVLDRAHVIEFRVSDEEMESFLKEPLKPDLESLKGSGKEMAQDFVLKSRTEITEFEDLSEIKTVLLEFFKELKKIGAEFGYRSASEIYRFAGMLNMLTEENGNKWNINDIVDAAVIQKLLPKVHGSRSKLDPVLKTLAAICYKSKEDYDDKIKIESVDFKNRENIKYPLSLEKILRMRERVIQDGFTSFTEA